MVDRTPLQEFDLANYLPAGWFSVSINQCETFYNHYITENCLYLRLLSLWGNTPAMGMYLLS